MSAGIVSLPDTGVSTLISAVLQPACTETITTSAPCPTSSSQASEADCNCAPPQTAAIIFGVGCAVLLVVIGTMYIRNRHPYRSHNALTPEALERHQRAIRLQDLEPPVAAGSAAEDFITPPAPVHLRDSTARNDSVAKATSAAMVKETARDNGVATTTPAASAQEDDQGKRKRMMTIHEGKEDSTE